MQILPIASQPNIKGKIIFEPGTTTNLTKYTPEPLWRKFKNISKLVAEKPYNIYIFKNKQNPDFYDIAANETLENAQKVKEYSVKIQSKAILDSILDAAKEAIDMYEKYISKSIKEL